VADPTDSSADASPTGEAGADAGAQAARLSSGAVEVLPEGRLAQQIAEGRPLRVKLGIDPTAPDIHLGHVVVLNKLRQFQDEGHTVVLIVGDFTARIGDPSGQSAERPMLSGEEIDANAETFQQQAYKILDPSRTEVRRNGEWLDMGTEELFGLLRNFTIARLLERDDFQKRMQAERPISALELLYPVMQGYDSVAIEADVELGGTDQKFNLLFARDVQDALGVPAQSVMTLPILPGTDGVQRMSKSLGNYVGVTDPPEEMFGKLMSVPDAAMGEYWTLLLGEQPPGGHPAEDKRELARRLVERFWDADAAAAAEQRFDQVHVRREAPDDMPTVELPGEGEVHLPTLIADGFGTSTSEARRLIAQGAVKLDGEPLAAQSLDVPAGDLEGRVLQVGKRRFARLEAGA
jgi:tyrosyl-tRNA synthetase